MRVGNVGRQHRQVMQVDNEGRYVGKQCRYVDNVGDDEGVGAADDNDGADADDVIDADDSDDEERG